MTIAVWLYDLSGAPLWCVYVPLPMPWSVQFNGLTFAWDTGLRRYLQVPPDAYPSGLAGEDVTEVPADDRTDPGAAAEHAPGE